MFAYRLSVLPWQNLQVSDKDRIQAVGHLKASTDLDELCHGLPCEFKECFEYLRKLTFKGTPDY